MAELWGGILRGIGQALASIYDIIPSYGLAIILLTVGLRIILIPLTVKQIRSMSAMQRIQPEIKKIQAKYKGGKSLPPEQRQQMNQEMMALYKTHGVNPLGGCFPILLQAPVFIALFSVLRAAVPVGIAAEPVGTQAFVFEKSTFCSPVGEVGAEDRDEIRCVNDNGDEKTFRITTADDGARAELPPFAVRCRPENVEDDLSFRCESPVGTGHLPQDSKLFDDIVNDDAKFLGLRLSCSPSQAASASSIRECSPPGSEAGGFPLIGYYGLIVLMAGTTWFQQKQLQARQGKDQPMAAQMQMMTRIMPFFLGFISLTIPTGVTVYWVASNIWTIGQQAVFMRKQNAGAPGTVVDAESKPVKGADAKPAKKDKAPKAAKSKAAKPKGSDDNGRPGASGRKHGKGKKKR